MKSNQVNFLFSVMGLAALLAFVCAPLLVFAAENPLTASALTSPQTGSWDRNALKALLDTPLVLFGVMLLASLTNGMKQISTAKRAGGDMTFAEYLSHAPDTIAMILGNALAFVILVSTDTLNLASAMGIGFGVNSITDMLPGKRSTELAQSVSNDKT